MNNNSLAHTKWNCKYPIVFTPKYRRKAIYGELKIEIGKILRELSNWKEVEIIEAHACIDHKHFWSKGYYVDTVGRNEKAIEEYVKNQEKEGMMEDQISMKEYLDPFKK